MIQIAIYVVAFLIIVSTAFYCFDRFVDIRTAELRRTIRRLHFDKDQLNDQVDQLVQEKQKLANELDRMFRDHQRERRGRNKRRGPGQR